VLDVWVGRRAGLGRIDRRTATRPEPVASQPGGTARGRHRGLQSKEHAIKQTGQERKRIKRRLDELNDEIGSTEANIGRLRDQRDRLTKEIERVEAAVEDLEGEMYDEVLDLHRTANDLGRLGGDLEDVEDEIAEAEAAIVKRASCETSSRL